MTDLLDRHVRAAVRDLAAQARPADLARSAIVRGVRLRRRMKAIRVAGATAAGAAVLSAIVVPSMLIGPRSNHAATSTPGPTVDATVAVVDLSGSVELPDGWTVTRGGGGPYQVWNRDQRAYQSVTGTTVYSAPAGPYVAIATDETRTIEVMDLRGHAPRQFTIDDGYILEPYWSPDGTRLLFTTLRKSDGQTFATILDAGSGEITRFPLDASYVCTDRCEFTWSRDGTEIIWPLSDQAAARSEAEPHLRFGLQVFSAADGHPVRTLAVRGEPSGAFAWSPNGRYVIVRGTVEQDGRRRAQNQLIDVSTGAVVREVPTDRAYWITNDRILLVARPGPAAIDLVDPTMNPLVTYALPASLLGDDVLELGLR